MGKPNGTAAIFALSLRRAIDTYEQRTGNGPMSLRRLGKLTDPTDPERGRRRAQRHLSGRIGPTPASARTYAEVLGAAELAPDDEDDESLDAALMREVLAAVSANPKAREELARMLETVA